MYKRIAGAETDAALVDVRAELQDRYGEPPESVLHLLAAGEIRLTCERLGIALIERKRTAVDEVKKAIAAPPPSQKREVGHPGQRPGYERQWNAGTAPRASLPGRHGQAPQSASLTFSPRAALNRTETNATRAARDVAGVRPAGAPLAQAGKMKTMREMLYVTFSDKLHQAPAEGAKGVGHSVNVGVLMKVVARNAKNGAQLTPQGVLKWPLSSAQADVVIRETRELLASLDAASGSQ